MSKSSDMIKVLYNAFHLRAIPLSIFSDRVAGQSGSILEYLICAVINRRNLDLKALYEKVADDFFQAASKEISSTGNSK